MKKRSSHGRCMGPVSSGDEFTGRSVAANLSNLKLNETLHLPLHSNFAPYFTLPNNKYIKPWEIIKGQNSIIT